MRDPARLIAVGGSVPWMAGRAPDILLEVKRSGIKTPEQDARAIGERQANRRAKEAGLPLPCPNMWDVLDPTKLDPAEATPEKIAERYREFRKLCPRRKRKIYTL